MRFRESTLARVERWTEFRATSGRWSKVKHDYEELEFGPVELSNFFAWQPKGQRIARAYFREGYLPYRVTVPYSDATMRHVYLFRYWTEEE